MQTLGPDAEEAKVSRSFLFVPADSDRKLSRAAESGADALILDLEDSVLAESRPAARHKVREFLADEFEGQVWVRINPLDTSDALDDLRAAVPAGPHGIVLPKPEGAKDANQLAKLLEVLEEEGDVAVGGTRILPVATERPAALFRLHEYAEATPRLAGLAWGAEDLSAAVGASANKDAAGRWLPPYEMARSLCLMAASAAGVPAIDTVYTDFKDTSGLHNYAANARRDGFGGMLAIHPDQIGIINKAFLPTDEEIERARRIDRLFRDNPKSGTLAMDGEMIDRPHWVQAQRILDLAKRN